LDTLVIGLSTRIPKSYFSKCGLGWKKFKNKRSKGSSLNYKGIHLQYCYSPYFQYLTLSVSVTKFLYGENFMVLNACDIEKLCFEINYILIEIFDSLEYRYRNPLITNIREWTLKRIDLVANFTCANDNVKKTTLDILKKLDYPYLKKKSFDTGLSARNNSISLNVYDKNAEVAYRKKTYNSSDNNNNILEKNLLRFEIQIKKNGIKSLINKGLLSGNRLADILSNLNNLNPIFRYYLDKYGISKKFLSEPKLNFFLKKLLKRKMITAKEYNNINSILIKQNKEVCENTQRKYIKILNKYNISHIITENPSKNKIDFNNFELFKNDQLKSSSAHKMKILIYFYFINLFTKKYYRKTQPQILINLSRPIKLIKICDDS
jgi:hypothetical protein